MSIIFWTLALLSIVMVSLYAGGWGYSMGYRDARQLIGFLLGASRVYHLGQDKFEFHFTGTSDGGEKVVVVCPIECRGDNLQKLQEARAKAQNLASLSATGGTTVYCCEGSQNGPMDTTEEEYARWQLPNDFDIRRN